MNKKEQIITSAVDLFYKKGFKKTTIEDIIKESQISNGSLFYHFKDKNTLISEAYIKTRTSLILASSMNSDENMIYRDKMRIFLETMLIGA